MKVYQGKLQLISGRPEVTRKHVYLNYTIFKQRFCLLSECMCVGSNDNWHVYADRAYAKRGCDRNDVVRMLDVNNRPTVLRQTPNCTPDKTQCEESVETTYP